MNYAGARPSDPSRPHSIEAEQCLLGAVIMNQDALNVVERRYPLVPDDFFEPVHQFLFEKISAAHNAGQRIDVGLVVAELRSMADTVLPGNMTVGAYVARLAAAATTVINAPDYARTIRELSDRRKLLDTAAMLTASAQGEASPHDCAAAAIEVLDEIATPAAQRDAIRVDIETASDRSLARMIKGMENPNIVTGVATGMPDIDDRTGGLQAGDLIILAGRPGMGKSGVAVAMVKAAAMNGVASLYFSLEMSEISLSDRILADLCYDNRDRITYESIARGRLPDDQAERVINAQRRLRGLPLTIELQGGLSLSQIAARARRHRSTLERKGGALGLIVVDHMHLVAASKRYSGQRVNEVTEISNGLKALAKELNVPVLALAQLSRQVETRDERRPTLSDLRDSGAIEQDADLIIFLYREAYYLERTKSDNEDIDQKREARLQEVRNALEANIAKNRNGEGGLVNLFFDAGCNAIRTASRWV
jgi:replicative DNA helicase